MRGTLATDKVIAVKPGIIPAHAGNTKYMSVPPIQWRDHPRACGEHYKHRGSITPNPGSSPRMRGTPCITIRSMFRNGIIPAHAGNTVAHFVAFAAFRDHPRACGEHHRKKDGDKRFPGSSPRMRGTRRRSARNTSISRDHPRACGEHHTLATGPTAGAGSSPRMRGTRQTVHRLRRPAGIIPAHAGNTF